MLRYYLTLTDALAHTFTDAYASTVTFAICILAASALILAFPTVRKITLY